MPSLPARFMTIDDMSDPQRIALAVARGPN